LLLGLEFLNLFVDWVSIKWWLICYFYFLIFYTNKLIMSINNGCIIWNTGEDNELRVCDTDRTHNLRWPRFWFIVVTNGKKYCFLAFSNILDFLDIFANFFGLKKKFTPRRPRRTDIRDRYRYHIGFSARPRPRPKPRF